MKPTQKQQVLARLKSGDWISNGELVFGMRITRASAIIYDLRNEGYEIEARHGKGSKYEYRLADNPLFAVPAKAKEYSH